MTPTITDKLTAALKFDECRAKDTWEKGVHIVTYRVEASRDNYARLAPLHLALVECVKVLQGCSDGNCRMLRPRGGQHTNGGCKCRDRAEQALARLAEVLK